MVVSFISGSGFSSIACNFFLKLANPFPYLLSSFLDFHRIVLFLYHPVVLLSTFSFHLIDDKNCLSSFWSLFISLYDSILSVWLDSSSLCQDVLVFLVYFIIVYIFILIILLFLYIFCFWRLIFEINYVRFTLSVIGLLSHNVILGSVVGICFLFCIWKLPLTLFRRFYCIGEVIIVIFFLEANLTLFRVGSFFLIFHVIFVHFWHFFICHICLEIVGLFSY